MLPSPLRSERRERGFSLVEVVIAMAVLSIVLGGAAMAVVSADSVESKTKAVADSHAMAEKAVERLRTDLTAQNYCDSTRWIADGRAAKLSNSTGEANFRECPVSYVNMRDAKGRLYNVQLWIDVKDKTDDGLGASDVDGDLRDHYDVEATVTLDGSSNAGREDVEPISVGATVDWETGSSDDAKITVIGCAIDRPDRALLAGGCNGTADESRTRLNNFSVQAYKVDEDTGSQTYAGSINSNGPGTLAPGTYKFVAPNTFSGFIKFKLDPENLRVYGSQSYTIQATYYRGSMPVQICTQVGNWDTKPVDDGYEVTRTNVYWRRTNQPGFRSQQVTIGQPNNPRQWRCGWVMLDPVQDGTSTPQNLFKGVYDLEVEQNALGNYSVRLPYIYKWNSNRPDYKLTVSGATMNCTNPVSNPAYTAPLNGTNLMSAQFKRSIDPVNERPNGAVPGGEPNNTNRNSFYARMPIDVGTQRLCLRFWSKNVERIRCYQHDNATGGNAPYKWTVDSNYKLKGCFYVGTICSLDLPAGTQDNDNNCWNGADVCVTCAGGAVSGNAGPVHAQRQSGGVSGGPNDTTVACSTRNQYNWPGSWHAGWGMSSLIGQGTRDSYDWIGGDSYYRSNFSGRTSARAGHPYGVHPDRFTYNLPDNPAYFCEMSYFTAGSALFAGNGGPYRYYECLEVSVPGRPYKVRGRLLDVSGSGNTFFGTVGTALALAPDSSIMKNYWNPFGVGGDSYPAVTGGGNWPDYNVARVTGDPNCGAPTIHIDPTIEEIWETIYNEPQYTQPPGPQLTNLTTDRIGV